MSCSQSNRDSWSAAINKVTMTASILHLVSYKMNYRLNVTELWSLRPVRRHSRSVNAWPGRPTEQKRNTDAFIDCDRGHKHWNWRNAAHATNTGRRVKARWSSQLVEILSSWKHQCLDEICAKHLEMITKILDVLAVQDINLRDSCKVEKMTWPP